MNVTYNDITNRIYAVGHSEHSGSKIKPRLYTNEGVFCENNAVDAIKHWNLLAENTDEAFEEALNIFEEICCNCNESTIRSMGSYLIENVDKVRDASKLQNSIKFRNSRLKTKIMTKINNKITNVSDAIKNSLSDLHNSLNAGPLGGASATTAKNNGNVAEACFNNLFAEATKCKECDRIIENYAKTSKRFNLDMIIYEATYPNDLYQAAWDIASCMDTYNVPFKNKYCCALENAYYAFNKNNIAYPSSQIVQAVTDYFIFTSGLSESDISAIAKTKAITPVFEQSDFDCLNFLLEDDEIMSIDDPEEDTDQMAIDLTESYGVEFVTEDLKDIKKKFKSEKKEVKKATKQIVKDAKKGNPDERLDKDVQDMIDDFRKDCAKDPDNNNNITRLKSLVTNMFAKTPYQIVYQLPNLFSIIRTGFIITALAINPVLGVVTTITDQIIKMTLTRKQTDKIYDAYKKEIDSVKAKIEKTKDEKTKENLQKYLDELNKDKDKIRQFRDDLYTDEENDERAEDDDEYDFDDDDLGINWDDDDFGDLEIESAANIITVSNLMQSISEGLLDTDVNGIVYNNIFKFDQDTIDALTDFSVTVPVILEKEKLAEALREHRDDLRKNNTSAIDYMRIDCINENLDKLEQATPVYNTSNDIETAINYLTCLDEIVKLNKTGEYVMEGMSLTNTLKLAIDKLKRTAVKLSDKEKSTSKSIDVAASQVAKGIETAMMNDNRESIIRGSVIPSASKCLKIAIAAGAAWAIAPEIAVIGALGAFACNKKMKKKERQLVLDEIEIELKMTERYIRQAEDEGDMKKLRQLEMTQRNLQRQHQRIKYSMNIYHQTAPNPENDD